MCQWERQMVIFNPVSTSGRQSYQKEPGLVPMYFLIAVFIFMVKSLHLSIRPRITCGCLLDCYTKLPTQRSKYPFKLFSRRQP